MKEQLYEAWSRRDPYFEIRFEDSVIKQFADYGKGVNKYNESRAKIYGAGYEILLVAFFIGLYNDKKTPLPDDSSKIKKLGWAMSNWGNIEARNGRRPYGKLMKYVFMALVAKTDIDFIALDKGEIKTNEAVDQLMSTMSAYANWGFQYLQDLLEEKPGYLFSNDSILNEITALIPSKTKQTTTEPESLDESSFAY